jgi:hypothetical protein
MSPTPPATEQLSDPIFTPEAALAGAVAAPAKPADMAAKITKDLKLFIVLS